MKDTICQHQWNRDFDPNHDRWNTPYRADFGYYNRSCYFLLDHGQSDTDDVPIVWYEWTGQSLLESSHFRSSPLC